jgi:hypothetical protein
MARKKVIREATVVSAPAMYMLAADHLWTLWVSSGKEKTLAEWHVRIEKKMRGLTEFHLWVETGVCDSFGKIGRLV